MGRENETKRIFGDNPVMRPRPAERVSSAQPQQFQRGTNTYEELMALRRPDDPRGTSRIITTPESIVRDHRRVVRLRTRGQENKILTRPPDHVPWQQKIDWNFTSHMIIIACVAGLAGWAIYKVVCVVIPFLRMLNLE